MMSRVRGSRELIDHSTFAKLRNRHGDALDGLLAELNREARRFLSAGPEAIAIDGTTMRANGARLGARTAAAGR